MNLSAILNIITGAVEQGLIYGILALGLLITYRILDFPDLTVDSSFPLGAAITALMTVNGYPPVLSLFAAAAAGAVAGLVTGLIHVRCHVRDLLSGIITMTGLYSINLRIAGKANLPFFANATLFKNPFTKSLPAWIAPYSTLIIILLIVLAAKLLLDWYLKTKAGFLLRAAGDNASVVTTLARDVGTTKIIGLMIANALVALSGAVMAQHQRSFDISMGTGTMVTGSGPHSGDEGVGMEGRLELDTRMLTYLPAAAMYVYLGLTAVVMYMLYRSKAPKAAINTGWVLIAMIIVQWAIGLIQYYLGVPRWTVPAHIAMSSVVVAFTAFLWAHGRRRPVAGADQAAAPDKVASAV